MEVDTKFVSEFSTLQQSDKQARIQALRQIRAQMLNQPLDRQLFDQAYIPILKCFKDSSETCREIAIEIMLSLITRLDVNDYYLTYIFPILTERLGDIIITEESEEIRLQMIKFIRKVIEIYQEKMVPFFDQLTQILTKTVLDPFAMVKQESCLCISDLTKAIPKHFHMQSDSYLKAVCQILRHQQFRIRILAIQCVSDVVEHSRGKIMDEVFVNLSCAMNDLIPNVRLTVIRTAHAWLLRQPDRYSYFTKMLPLLLLGLTDEIESLVDESKKLWKEVGEQYALENEKDLKDKLDYLDEIEKANNKFSIGCRMLVIRNTMHLLSGVCNDLSDWRVEIRQMSARLLYTIVLHNEEDITQHLQKLLPEMARATNDESSQVVDYIQKTAELIGTHVSPNVYCAIILPGIERQSSLGQLSVLALLMQGSKPDELSEKLKEVVEVLLHKDISQTRSYGKEILNCCKQVIKVCKKSCSIVEYELFVLLTTIISLNEFPDDLLINLSEVLSYPSIEEMYKKNCPTLLTSLKSYASTWTVVTPERYIFEFLLKSKSNFCENFHLIYEILQLSLTSNPDCEVRLKLFLSLSEVLIDIDNIDFKHLVNDLITPNLVWHAGRLNESLRSAVILCLCACLPTCVKEVPLALINTLIGLLDERSPTTRVNVLKAIGCIAEAHRIPSGDVNKIYPELLKRLDDSLDSVRVEAAITLQLLWNSLDATSYKADSEHAGHLEYFYSTLLIHLDDHNPVLQERILDLLKCVGKLNKKQLIEKLEKGKDKFRDKDVCQNLLEALSITS